jgi:hypothetical protein
MESRMIKDNDWKDSLFIARKEQDLTLITFPKNVESFADSLFMISLIKLCQLNGWRIQLSTKELPTSVFESNEGAFFAGFVAGSMSKETGERIKGTTRFTKGMSAYQAYSVEKAYGKAPHLHTGGMDALMQRLSAMKGFTKEYWGIRGSLAAILKMIKPCKVTHLKTFMMPKQDILKSIRTKLAFENGGLFRTEEITYLTTRYQTVKKAVSEFTALLDNPSDDLAAHLVERFSPIKVGIEKVDSEIRLLAVNRSKILFPAGTKKGIKKFKEKSLDEKLNLIEESKLTHFTPESLPGIGKDGSSDLQEGSPNWLRATYSAYANDLAREVISSWYLSFTSSEEDE